MIMSTIAGYVHARDFLPETKTGRKRPSLWVTLRLIAEAVREGHVAANRYRELTHRGIAHDKAARQVFTEIYAAS
jgi:hypothetical protein